MKRYPGHDLESCYTLRDGFSDLNDQNRLDWNEIDAIFGSRPRNLSLSSGRWVAVILGALPLNRSLGKESSDCPGVDPEFRATIKGESF